MNQAIGNQRLSLHITKAEARKSNREMSKSIIALKIKNRLKANREDLDKLRQQIGDCFDSEERIKLRRQLNWHLSTNKELKQQLNNIEEKRPALGYPTGNGTLPNDFNN